MPNNLSKCLLENKVLFLYPVAIVILVGIVWYFTKNLKQISKQIEKFSNYENTVYLFLTGGYDSTFRLCQALIDEKKIVYPYYISYDVDNCKDCKFKRQSKNIEMDTIKAIMNKITTQFPETINRLKPLTEVTYIAPNEEITDNIYKRNMLHRKYNQYEAMCRYAYYQNKKMEIGSVGILGTGDGNLSKDRWGVYLRNNLTNINGHYGISDKSNPLHNLRFPLAYLSKNDLKDMAITNGYIDILKMTWSCWFPENGKPCKKCNMCRERVIPQINRK